MRADVGIRTIQFAEGGKREVTRGTLEAIAFALNLDYEDVIEGGNRDAFLEAPWGLFKFVQRRLRLSDLAFCRQEDDALVAIGQMRDSWRTHLHAPSSEDEREIFLKADRILNEHYDSYEQRYLSIWKQNPGTFVFSVSQRERTGMSVILPVTDSAYERLRTGEISFMDISASDILGTSQNLVVDSAVEFSNCTALPWYRITESLSFAVFSQMTMLASNPGARDFRMLSFGASPANIERLKSTGFVFNGRTMPVFEFPVCEFTGNNNDLTEDTYERTSTVSHILHLLNRRIDSNSSVESKRRMVIRYLKLSSVSLPLNHPGEGTVPFKKWHA